MSPKRKPKALRRQQRPQGQVLDEPFVWAIYNPPAPSALLRALGGVLTASSILYLEGTGIAKDVRYFLSRHRIPPRQRIAPDTLSPPRTCYHLPATQAVLVEVAALFDAWPAKEVAHHIKVYDRKGILLDWHDADTGWPAFLSSRFTVQDIHLLTTELGCECERVEFGA